MQACILGNIDDARSQSVQRRDAGMAPAPVASPSLSPLRVGLVERPHLLEAHQPVHLGEGIKRRGRAERRAGLADLAIDRVERRNGAE